MYMTEYVHIVFVHATFLEILVGAAEIVFSDALSVHARLHDGNLVSSGAYYPYLHACLHDSLYLCVDTFKRTSLLFPSSGCQT